MPVERSFIDALPLIGKIRKRKRKAGLETKDRDKATATHDLASIEAAVDRILAASEAQLSERTFLLDCVRQVGIAFHDWEHVTDFYDFVNSSEYGLLQPSDRSDRLSAHASWSNHKNVVRNWNSYGRFFRLFRQHT